MAINVKQKYRSEDVKFKNSYQIRMSVISVMKAIISLITSAISRIRS